MDLGTGRIVPRKRRHGTSNDSSIIQIAKPDFLINEGEDEDDDDDDDYEKENKSGIGGGAGGGSRSQKKQRGSRPADFDDSESSSSGDTQFSWSSSPPRQRSQRNHERQPRRKMREEGRAEIELGKELSKRQKAAKRSHPGGKDKKKRKKKETGKSRKRSKGGALREKSSNILHQAFESEHVTNDRLTLKPSLGLFKKGKASTPARAGLPDLVFSEMKFLSRESNRYTGDTGSPQARKRTETTSGYFPTKTKSKKKNRGTSKFKSPPRRGLRGRSIRSKSVTTMDPALQLQDEDERANRFRRSTRQEQARSPSYIDPKRYENSPIAQDFAKFPRKASAPHFASHHLTRRHENEDHSQRVDSYQRVIDARNSSLIPSSNIGNSGSGSSDQSDTFQRLRKEHAEKSVRTWLENPEEVARPIRYRSEDMLDMEKERAGTVAGENVVDIQERFYVDSLYQKEPEEQDSSAHNDHPGVPNENSRTPTRDLHSPKDKSRASEENRGDVTVPTMPVNQKDHSRLGIQSGLSGDVGPPDARPPYLSVTAPPVTESYSQTSQVHSNARERPNVKPWPYGSSAETNIRPRIEAAPPEELPRHTATSLIREEHGSLVEDRPARIMEGNAAQAPPGPRQQPAALPMNSLVEQYRRFVQKENVLPTDLQQASHESGGPKHGDSGGQQEPRNGRLDELESNYEDLRNWKRRLWQPQKVHSQPLPLPTASRELRDMPRPEQNIPNYPPQQGGPHRSFEDRRSTIKNQATFPIQDQGFIRDPRFDNPAGPRSLGDNDWILERTVGPNSLTSAENEFPADDPKDGRLLHPLIREDHGSYVVRQDTTNELPVQNNVPAGFWIGRHSLAPGFRPQEEISDIFQVDMSIPQPPQLSGQQLGGAGGLVDDRDFKRRFWRPQRFY